MINLGAEANELVALIGPAIRQENYEIDQLFFHNFVSEDPFSSIFFKKIAGRDKFLFDLPSYASKKLGDLGIKFFDIGLDTFTGEKDFLSFRRNTIRNLSSEGNIVSAIMLK